MYEIAVHVAYKVSEEAGEYVEFGDPTKLPPVAAVYQPVKV